MREGGCICGDVRYRIASEPTETGACHCGMCRKFSGGVYLAVKVDPGDFEVIKAEGLTLYQSSDWAERAHCKRCGSSLFYRVTIPGPMQGECHVALGTLDDANGIPLTGEIYIDRKPDGYSFAQDTHKMTEEQVVAMFSAPSGA